MQSCSIGIIDYGLGNLHSVIKAVRFVGLQPKIIKGSQDLLSFDGLIIPGVGAFGEGIARLKSLGLINPLKEYALSGKFVLGICLGMQFLFSSSDEHGSHDGLGLIDGKVVYFPEARIQDGYNYKVPHIGWNKLIIPPSRQWEGTILNGSKDGDDVYFIHSYVAIPEQEADVLAFTEYGGNLVTAAVKKGNLYGCQFHPEKSRQIGINIIKNFICLASGSAIDLKA